jgi:hypothetical protein
LERWALLWWIKWQKPGLHWYIVFILTNSLLIFM